MHRKSNDKSREKPVDIIGFPSRRHAAPVRPTPSIPMRIPESRLPRVGTTIFTTMSALAVEHDAVNLGQGFPDFSCDPALLVAVDRAMRAGHNQYPPMAGWAPLRHAISEKIATLYDHRYDPATEITVTAGGTQAILTAVLALVHPGDDVLVIEPVYDSYVPAIALAGATPRFVRMKEPDAASARFTIPWDEVESAITPKTRMIIVNSPNNPTGTTLQSEDLDALERIAEMHDLLVLSDEVYEHMVFDGRRHESVSRRPALAARSVVVSSFGKTFHVTGWKVGYAAAPAALMAEFRKVHQFNVFTVNTPMQAALADYMANPAPYLQLSAFYQSRRDLFANGLDRTRFERLPVEGSYFQLVRYAGIRDDLDDVEFSRWLTTEIGVAAIPLSSFYEEPISSRMIRFCFAKKEETLTRAIDRLAAI